MNRLQFAAVTGLIAAANLCTGASEPTLYDDTKATVTEWAETENLISKERNDWEKEKAILENLAQMLETEKEELAAQIEESKNSATEADKRRNEINARKEELEAANAVVKNSITDLENDFRDLIPYLPEKYVESVGPMLRRLPQDGKDSQLSLSVRLQNIVGLLTQANKFDNVISLETETRDFEGEGSKQVTTLYLGLAIAYYADATGEYAGYGYPTEDGWEWEESEDDGPAILDAIAMYEKGKQAAFVELPVVIK